MTMLYLLVGALVIGSSLPSATALTVSSQQRMRAKMQAREGMHARVGMHMQTQLVDVNPIAKVLALLRKMLETNKKIDEEANAICEKSLCEWGRKIKKQQAIVDHYAGNLGPLEEEYVQLYAKVHMLKLDIRKAEKEIDELEKALQAMKDAKETRIQKQIEAYKQNLPAIERAIVALRKGLGANAEQSQMDYHAAFLQTGTAETIRQVISSMATMSDAQRDALGAFLDGGDGRPGTEEVIGILRQIYDRMVYDLKELELHYTRENASWEALVAAKQKEIDELKLYVSRAKYQMADYLTRLNELHEQIVDILEGGYLREKMLLDEMQAEYDKIKAECDKQRKLRAEEAAALQDVLGLLNTEESLDLFKKTLPGMTGTLLQVSATSKQLLKRADLTLHNRLTKKGRRDYRVDAICLAMMGKKVDMTKVVDMIDTLIAVLNKEGEDEAEKKDYCRTSMGEAMFKKKFLYETIGPIKAAMAETQAAIDEVKAELTFVAQSIKDLDKAIEEAKAERMAENKLYMKEMATDRSAMDLLKVSKTRLAHFYGVMLQIAHAHHQPEQNTHSGSEVIGMLEAIIKELGLHMAENADAEKRAQEDYEQMLKSAEDTKAEKLEYMRKLYDDRAELEMRYDKHFDEYREWQADDEAIMGTIAMLHKSCDWLMENFEYRVEARKSEIDALHKARSVLLGADVDVSDEEQVLAAYEHRNAAKF